MNFFRKHWETYKAKSLWGKISDVLFIILVAMMISKDGRILMQRAILQTGLFGSTSANTNDRLSEDALQWRVHRADGSSVSIGELAGKTIFINHWATWCPPCNAEMPGIIELMSHCERDVAFLFVTNETPDRVSEHLNQKGWSIPVYFAQTSPPIELAASVLPTTLVIDENGNLIHRSDGMRQWNNDEALNLLHCTSKDSE